MSSAISKNPSLVSQWRSQYSKGYVAHAIYTEGVAKKVLEKRRLAPGEHIFRKQGVVEYKIRTMPVTDIKCRATQELPNLAPEEIEKLQELEQAIEQELKAEEKGEKEGKEYTRENLPYGVIVFENLKPKDEIFDACGGYKPSPSDAVKQFWGYVQELGTKHLTKGTYDNIHRFHVMMAYDQSKPKGERFDVKLAAYFQEACKRHELTTYEDPEAPPAKQELYGDLYKAMAAARELAFGFYSITDTIRAEKRGNLLVFWHCCGVTRRA